ncbi:MAG TPA: hypothetical protein VGP11_00015 [Acidimicrobiales bacterium]|nr:hypothetical protein [Acidimicrobiales bacterium]
MSHLLCVFSPASCLTSLGKSTFNDLFNALTSWILASVQWILTSVASVLTSASEPTVVMSGARSEFTTLLVAAPVLMMLGLLVSTLQALRHGDVASLWRVFLGVAPACVAGIVLARPIATLILDAVNQLSTSAAATVAQHETTLAKGLESLTPTTPGFGVFLLAGVVVIGAMLLWFELIVRVVVLTLLVVLVPVVVPLATFPSLRRIGWRLAETFITVAASKFVIVVTLVLGLDELTGSSATEVIVGAVTLLFAAFTPYLVLRVVPVIEQSALHQFDGVRSRATRAVMNAPSSPAGQLAQAMRPDVPLPEPPQKGPDLGLDAWPGVPETPVPPSDGDPPPPPIGTRRRRGGHVVYQHDDKGPVVGWHFDE